MRKTTWLTCLCMLLLGVVSAAAQQRDPSPSDFFGTWTGSWQMGTSSGGFELMLEKGKDGPAGGVSVTGEQTYKATLKTISFKGNTMKATYDFTPDPSLEVVLNTTFDGNSSKGTWSAVQKSNGSEVAAGTWTVSRK